LRRKDIAQKRHCAEKPENRERVSVRVRFWNRVRVRVKDTVRTFAFIDFIVSFIMFLRNVFSAKCRGLKIDSNMTNLNQPKLRK